MSKTAIEKFVDTLSKEEKELLTDYIYRQDYERLSAKFDKLLGKPDENS